MFSSQSSRTHLLFIASLLLSWSWLLPNHYQPWTSFHMDGWSAIVFILIGLYISYFTRSEKGLSSVAAFFLTLSVVPWIQYFSGIINSPSVVWIPFLFLVGCGVAVELGRRWRALDENGVNDFLFLAVGVAAVFSVGWQLIQWLSVDVFYFWSMGGGSARPFANMGQPNQLGTLLLWGVLGLTWGYIRGFVGLAMTIFASSFLAFGFSLAASRTAFLGYVLVVAFIFLKRRLLKDKVFAIAVIWIVFGGAAIYFSVNKDLFFAKIFFVDSPVRDLLTSSAERLSAELRPAIWRMLLEALAIKPFAGFGWGQLGHAQLEVGAEVSNVSILVGHAHNLFLDIFLWNGVPLGMCISGLIVYWIGRGYLKMQSMSEWMMFAPLLVFLNHAMLELPHHYLYFLLPVSLWVGALSINHSVIFDRKNISAGVIGFAFLLIVMWVLVLYDYVKIESNYWASRFSKNGYIVETSPIGYSPILFTHLQDYLVFDAFSPAHPVESGKIEWMQSVVLNYPSVATVHKFAAVLAWSGRKDDARLWLEKICRMTSVYECKSLREAWERQASIDGAIKAVGWNAEIDFQK